MKRLQPAQGGCSFSRGYARRARHTAQADLTNAANPAKSRTKVHLSGQQLSQAACSRLTGNEGEHLMFARMVLTQIIATMIKAADRVKFALVQSVVIDGLMCTFQDAKAPGIVMHDPGN